MLKTTMVLLLMILSSIASTRLALLFLSTMRGTGTAIVVLFNSPEIVSAVRNILPLLAFSAIL